MRIVTYDQNIRVLVRRSNRAIEERKRKFIINHFRSKIKFLPLLQPINMKNSSEYSLKYYYNQDYDFLYLNHCFHRKQIGGYYN